MEALFLHLLNMSLTASWLILAVLLVRVIFKKAPKALICLLWAIVAVRLLCPISFESVLSLVPSAEPIPQEILFSPAPSIDSGIPIVNEAVNPALSESLAPNPGDSVNPLQIVAAVAANVWILGVAAMLIYAVVSYIRVYRKVRIRMPLDARTCLCDDIDTPFIFGILRPQIFLPSSLSDADRSYVIAHEQAHLKRLDHLWKPLGFALLTVYWFNPLLWVAYIVLCRDIELACDEKVIRDMNREDTAAYTQALLHCSSKQKFVTACPLAFGESGVKVRIKNALNYKKPAFWLILLALAACIAVTVCFLTDPLKRDNEPDSIGAGSELDGVSVAMKELDLSAEQPALTIRWQNDTDKDLIYGESFRLYRLEDGRLIDTNLVKNSAFSAIGLMLAPYQHIDKTYPLTGYNLSENGMYRFESTVSIHGVATSYKVWVDFAVENGTATMPLIAATAPYTIGGAVLPDTKENVRVIYPVLESDTQDFEILNTFLKNNIEEKLYRLQQEYPRGSAIDLYFAVNYDDGTLISVLFDGTVTPPEGEAVNVAFTACLAPGNGYTVNPESLFTMDDYFLNTFRDKWLALWDDANLTAEKGLEIRNTINGYTNEELAALLRDGKTADFGFTSNGILVVFRGKPNIGDYALITVPTNTTATTTASTTTTTVATTTTVPTTTTTAPAPIIAVNSDLLSEVGMSFSHIKEKHGEVTKMHGTNGPCAITADGSGHYVFKDGFGALECGYISPRPEEDENGMWLLDPIPQPKPDAIIKAMCDMKASLIFLGLTENMTGEQLADMYGVVFDGTTPSNMHPDGRNLCTFIFEDVSISVKTGDDFIITPDSLISWIYKYTPAPPEIQLNPDVIDDLGKTYAEIEKKYRELLSVLDLDEISFTFKTPKWRNYVFDLTQSEIDAILQAPTENGMIVPETSPRPADDRICKSIVNLINASNLFMRMPSTISPEELAEKLGAELTYVSHNLHPNGSPVGYDKVLFRCGNYEILIMCNINNQITQTTTVEYIKLLEY